MEKENDLPKVFGRGVMIKRAQLEIEKVIHLPKTAKTPTNEGIVMGVGTDLKGKIEVGQRVIFNDRGNAFVIHNDQTFLVCHENDVYARVNIDDAGGRTLSTFNKGVLVEKGRKELKLAGVIIPDSQKLINYGRLLCAGDECPEDIKAAVGKMVLYNPNCDFSFLFNHKEVMMMYSLDVICELTDKQFGGLEDVERERRADIPYEKLKTKKEAEEEAKDTKPGIDDIIMPDDIGLGKN